MKISILTPTRGRCARAQKFAHSVLTTAAVPEEIELLFYVDNDDPQLADYLRWKDNAQSQIEIMIGPPISVSKSWNRLAERCKGDILIMGNDDLVYRTDSWDNILAYNLLGFPDKIYVMWFKDGINNEKHCAFPIVSRLWYETVGYFTPGIFEFLYNDTWVYDIGLKVERTWYIPDIYVEHEHFSTGKMVADETTIRQRRSGSTARDRELFEKTDGSRKIAAEKLQKLKQL